MRLDPADHAKHAERLLQVIRTQTDIVRLGLDLGGVMAVVATRSQALTGADGAVVELAEGDEMVYRAATGIAAPHLGLRLQRGTSLSGLCVQAGTALRCDDSDCDGRVDREACRRIGIRAMIVVPLRHGDEAVGVLKVVSANAHAFDDADTQTLDLMSGLIAASIHHAAAHESGDLFFRATHDALTGLPNRALFYERLRQCLALAQREAGCAGVLMLDMDGLKPINDELGHRAGDAALQEMARRIRNASRATDTVARLGGDEFGVILQCVDRGEGVAVHGRRLTDRIAQPFEFESRSMPLGASVGAAMYPDDSDDLTALMETADKAMYADKRTRKVARV